MNTKIKRMLVGISGMSRKVLAAVAQIAHKSAASVDLVTVVRPLTAVYGLSPAVAAMNNRIAASAELKRLEKLAQSLRAAGVSVDCHVELNGSVTEGLLRCIYRSKPSLVAIEAHKHNVLAPLLTQIDYDLIRHCPVPLLIVNSSARNRRSKIIAVLDPFGNGPKAPALATEIVAAAHGFAHLFRGAVHGAHIYSPLMGFVGATYAPVAIPSSLPEERRYVSKARTTFRAFCSRNRIKPRNVHLEMGDPRLVLPTLARSTKARMVVMGAAVQPSGVLDAMPCDMLIVKPPGFAAAMARSGAKAA